MGANQAKDDGPARLLLEAFAPRCKPLMSGEYFNLRKKNRYTYDGPATGILDDEATPLQWSEGSPASGVPVLICVLSSRSL